MENLMNLSQEKTMEVFNNAALTEVGNTMIDGVTHADYQLAYFDYWPYYETYHHYYPYPTVIAPNRVETAYKVVKVLLDKKLAKIQTVKELVELLDELVKVL